MTQAVLTPEAENVNAVAETRRNGAAAAAILAASIGSLALGVLTILSDRSAAWKSFLAFYKPTGALSGVTTIAIILWLVVWILLDRIWKDRNVSLRKINIAAIILLTLSLLATFPPIGNLF
jgi:hypothetical protein